MQRRRHGWRGGRALIGLVLLSLTAGTLASCSKADNGTAANPTPSATVAAPPFTLAVTPDGGAANVPVSAEVGIALVGGEVSTVSVHRAGGDTLAGSMRQDGTSWVPDAPLDYSASYQATVTSHSPDGRELTKTTTFTTMAAPGRTTDTGLYMSDGQTVGVGLPVVVEFDPPVADSARAEIQKRLFVSTFPPQPGVWHWASGRQVWYRAPEYWKEGTTISVRAALKGVPTGDGNYGDIDRSATVKVGQKVVMAVDNANKQMKVYVDDALVKQLPVSLGKPSTPSSSGNMVTMSHDYSTIFDTTREGPGGYRVQVNYAMRLTWGGEFIHAAPWSVGDQGVRNVSHGCLNMSMDNSSWLFGITHIGDPVSVTGTEVALENGNGWTAWNQSWSEYVKGSALPIPAELAAGTPPPAPAPAAGAAKAGVAPAVTPTR